MQPDNTCPSPTISEHHGRRNILIVGDVGVGKSSLVNLIAGDNLANTSSGVKSCTLHSREYHVVVDGKEIALHDTAGLHEGQMRTADYLDAVHQAYALISKLERSGGISLLVFCMRGGRISITTQQTYRLFVEVLCNRQVPVVFAVTHLEMFDNMEQWWEENKGAIKEYGLKSLGHACITATRGYRGIFDDKYKQSEGIIRNLLLDYSDWPAWKEEKASWVKRVVLHMRAWLSPCRQMLLDYGDLKKKLTKRCGFSAKDAELVAQKIVQLRGQPEDAPEEEKSCFGEKFRTNNDSDSCVSLPSVSYTHSM